MQAMANQRAPLYAAQAADAQARQGLVAEQTKGEQAKTAEILQQMNLTTALQNLSPAGVAALQKGDTSDPAVGPLLGNVMAETGANKGDVAKAMQTLVALTRAASGDVNGAANVENSLGVANNIRDNAVNVANNIRNNAVNAAKPIVTPSGATLFTPQGQMLAQGGVSLNPGQTRFVPQGNLLAGLSQDPGVAPSASDVDNPDEQDQEAPPTATATPWQAVASGIPLPVNVPKPVPPASLPPSVQGPLFRQILANSQGGTNYSQAMDVFNRLNGIGQPNPATASPAAPNPATASPAAPNPATASPAAPNPATASPAAQNTVGVANPATKLPTVIQNQADYDALPVGSNYIDSFGKMGTKRGK
jgi:hypothetical protein